MGAQGLLDCQRPQLVPPWPFLHLLPQELLRLVNFAELLPQLEHLADVPLLLRLVPVLAQRQHHLLGLLYCRLQQQALVLEDPPPFELLGEEGHQSTEDMGGLSFGEGRGKGPGGAFFIGLSFLDGTVVLWLFPDDLSRGLLVAIFFLLWFRLLFHFN